MSKYKCLYCHATTSLAAVSKAVTIRNVLHAKFKPTPSCPPAAHLLSTIQPLKDILSPTISTSMAKKGCLQGPNSTESICISGGYQPCSVVITRWLILTQYWSVALLFLSSWNFASNLSQMILARHNILWPVMGYLPAETRSTPSNSGRWLTSIKLLRNSAACGALPIWLAENRTAVKS